MGIPCDSNGYRLWEKAHSVLTRLYKTKHSPSHPMGPRHHPRLVEIRTHQVLPTIERENAALSSFSEDVISGP